MIQDEILYVLGFSFGVIVSFICLMLIAFSYKRHKLNNYVYLLASYTIASVSLISTLMGVFLREELFHSLSVYLITFAFIPMYILGRKIIKKRKRYLLDFVYSSIILAKIIDLFLSPPVLVSTSIGLVMVRARGIVGSTAVILDFLLIYCLLTYLVIGSVYVLGARFGRVIISLLFASIFLIIAMTIFLASGIRLSGLYMFFVSLYGLLLALVFSLSPAITSLIPFKLKGYALMDKEGSLITYRVRRREDIQLFFEKIGSIRIESYKEEFKVRRYVVESTSLLIFSLIEKYLIIYGYELDVDVVKYFNYVLRKIPSHELLIKELEAILY